MALSQLIKAAGRTLLPQSIVNARRRALAIARQDEVAGLSNREIFSEIYDQGVWGAGGDDAFCSGSGSHDEQITRPYVEAVGAFLASLPAPPNAVDLGCGDFNVGRQLRGLCASYVACDVVPALIERNAAKFGGEFRCIDIVSDELPAGEVVFVRQVLQHLDNAQIARIVPKLSAFRYAVITEHLPDGRFVPNADHPPGKGIRLSFQSGIVLTARPFSMRVKSERVLCTVTEGPGIIQTTLYEMEPPLQRA